MYLNLKINNFKHNQKIQKSRSKKIDKISKNHKTWHHPFNFQAQLHALLQTQPKKFFFLTTTNFYSLCRHKKKIIVKKNQS